MIGSDNAINRLWNALACSGSGAEFYKSSRNAGLRILCSPATATDAYWLKIIIYKLVLGLTPAV